MQNTREDNIMFVRKKQSKPNGVTKFEETLIQWYIEINV